jgi:PAS domain-containing protein
MPIGIVDSEGSLIFYNEPAEAILNQRFEETGDMTAKDWTAIFAVADENRTLLPQAEWPLVIAYTKRQAVSRVVWLRCRDGEWRNVSFTAFPIIGQGGQFLGAMTLFWEV